MALVRGIAAGVVATFAMLPPELVAFSRYRLHGVFEWHEVHPSLAGYQSHRPFGPIEYAAHLALGGVVGAAFVVGIGVVSFPVIPAAIALGFAFWVGTLLIHKRATAIDPIHSGMGYGPLAATLIGHLLYGATLGLLLVAW